MRNLQIALALVVTLGFSATACTGEMVPLGGGGVSAGDDDGDDTSNQPPAGAEATFNSTVKSLLTSCSGCHANTTAIGFLGGGGDSGYYAALMASDVIDEAAPASSTLLTHTHSPGTGVEFDATQRAAVLSWIQAEGSQ